MKRLTKTEAAGLKPGTVLWMEEIGGYEGTRYAAEKIAVTGTDDDALSFMYVDHPGASGRTWRGYNRAYCGWRLWEEKPTHDEYMAAAWDR